MFIEYVSEFDFDITAFQDVADAFVESEEDDGFGGASPTPGISGGILLNSEQSFWQKVSSGFDEILDFFRFRLLNIFTALVKSLYQIAVLFLDLLKLTVKIFGF